MAQRNGGNRRVIGTIVGGGEGAGFHREWVVVSDRNDAEGHEREEDDESPR